MAAVRFVERSLFCPSPRDGALPNHWTSPRCADGRPIPYATVIELAAPSGAVLNGTTTGEDGRFAVPSVQVEATLVVTFIGFRPDTLRGIRPQGPQVDVGIIALQPDKELLDVAEVQAEQSTTTFALDKRVFNVGKDLSTTGASALEVLNNVPSVTVSIEGENQPPREWRRANPDRRQTLGLDR